MNIFIFTEDFNGKHGDIHCTPKDWIKKEQLSLFADKEKHVTDIVIHKKDFTINSKRDIIILDSIIHEFTAKALHFAGEIEIPLLIINHNKDAYFPKVHQYPIIFKKESNLDEESILHLIQSTKDKLPRGTGGYFTKFFSVEDLLKYEQKNLTKSLFQ